MSEGTAKSGSPPNGYHPLPAGFACKCVRVWQDGKGNYWCCRPVAVEMPGSEPGKATLSERETVQPAAMPSEEDVARALCIADGKDPDFDYDPLGLGRPAGTDLRWRCYLTQARAVRAFFARILAEKELHHVTGERITRKDLNNAYREGSEKGRLAAHLIDGVNSPLNACCYRDGCRALGARALAAEAALAAERERCAKVAEDHGVLVSNEPIGKACSRNIAAAIRAQGE